MGNYEGAKEHRKNKSDLPYDVEKGYEAIMLSVFTYISTFRYLMIPYGKNYIII